MISSGFTNKTSIVTSLQAYLRKRAELQQVRDIGLGIIRNAENVIVGKRDTIEQAVISLICQGHVLIEDVPGVGKTVLARSLAKSIGSTFKRIQFTPDLLPGDVTGISIYNQKTSDFEFRPGPVIAQIVLADEINRATPKTQSSLLECMEERQVTVDGITHEMPYPFMVMATQNPIEYEGTFPLPEAQLDRFLMRISLGYPDTLQEITIMENQQLSHPIEQLGQVTQVSDLVQLQEAAKGVYLDDLIKQYIVALVSATRSDSNVYLGASPRGSLSLFRAAQARSLLQGRDYVLPDDIKALAEPVLAHRLIIAPAARMRDVTGRTVINEILETVPIPGVRPRSKG